MKQRRRASPTSRAARADEARAAGAAVTLERARARDAEGARGRGREGVCPRASRSGEAFFEKGGLCVSDACRI